MLLPSEVSAGTLKDMLLASATQHADTVALRHKAQGQWHELTYRDLLARVRQASELLRQNGVSSRDKVAILRENGYQWPELYFGIVCIGATAVPIDAKLLAPEVTHILRDSEASFLFTDVRHYPIVREAVSSLSHLKMVAVSGLTEVQPVISKHVRYIDYDDSLEHVREVAQSDKCAFDKLQPAPDSIASFIYTSGTTGRQKGAMLTHANFLANLDGIMQAVEVFATDSFLLVLPLHHAFAFTTNLLLPIACGAEISFVENLRTVGENIREICPTIICAVPLLLEKMYAKIEAGLKANKVARMMLALGIRKPVIKGIAKKLGGNLRICVSGGAACDPDVLRGFMQLGVGVIEGYGLTETAPVLTLTPPDKPRPGTVGRPIPNVEITILEPNAEGIGEIAARGPNIMLGYYNYEKATREAFKDGWFLTGDLGFIDEDGFITITGRKKDLIINREGKNIYPAEVEAAILKNPYVMEALVLSYQEPQDKVGERLGVIVVPDQDALDEYGDRHHDQLTDKDLAEIIRREVRKAASCLSEYKRPRRVQIRSEEFEKTSTGKIKRYLYALDALSLDH